MLASHDIPMPPEAHHEVARLAAHRAAAAACGTASALQATAAAPLWRALSDESVAWLFTLMPSVPERDAGSFRQ